MTRSESSAPAWDAPPAYVDFCWRHIKAKAIPRREIEIPTHVPIETRTKSDVPIEQVSAPRTHRPLAGPVVHRAGEQYAQSTVDRATALRLLKSVPAPLTVVRVERALEWRRARAKYWLERFECWGVLVKTSKTVWEWA